MGSFCSILLLFLTVSFAYLKVDVFLARKDNNIMNSTKVKAIADDLVFSVEDGLNFAVAFTAYDDETEDILDPTYGNVAFRNYEWGPTPDGGFFENFDEIPSHTCTKEELGMEGDYSSFYPLDSDH